MSFYFILLHSFCKEEYSPVKSREQFLHNSDFSFPTHSGVVGLKD